MAHTSTFKTSEGEISYNAAYEAAMEQCTVPYEELEVPSRFGKTYVVASGPQDAPPLVLLHGFMGTLTMWVPYIEDFTKEYRVYAVDTIGHPNRSVPDEPVRDVADYAEWLSATLDGLNLDCVSMAGISFGGWLSLNLAINSPERVHKLALLSPAASFQPLSRQFGLRVILSQVIPTRSMMESLMGWMGLKAESDDAAIQNFLDLMWLGGEHFQMLPEVMRIMPTVFSDDELRALQTPVLLLIGEDEVIYNPAKALARARQLVPDFEGDLVPGCRHDMYSSQHQIVGERVLQFLNDG